MHYNQLPFLSLSGRKEKHQHGQPTLTPEQVQWIQSPPEPQSKGHLLHLSENYFFLITVRG